MYFRKSYPEIVNSVLDHMIKGVTDEKHTFYKSKLKYEFECRPEYRPVKKIHQIVGFFGANKHTFKSGKDYELKENEIVWLNNESDIPDDRSVFEVTYSFENLSVLSDINVGSVLRTLVESIGREIEFLYDEMESVYDSGFIDTAKADALDLVVSMLGIKRKEPTEASGYVTFIRDTNPTEIINNEIILLDGREGYELKVKPVIKILSVIGEFNGEKHSFLGEKDYVLDSNFIRWLEGGDKPDLKKEAAIEYSSYQNIIIPKGTIVSTLPKKGEADLLFRTVEECSLQKISEGKWEQNARVISLAAGTGGNILPGTIKVMPSPVEGVDKVINRSNLAGGAEKEDDDSLRTRAKKILDVKGKATLESLRTALEGIDGIQTTPVLIDMPEGVQGVVRAIIDGGDEKEIEKIIEQTRAAGIKVEYSRPKMVLLDMDIVLLVLKGTEDLPKIVSASEVIVKRFVSSLSIGESLIINQLVSLLLETSGVIDVRSMSISAVRDSSKSEVIPAPSTKVDEKRSSESQNENILIMPDERPYPREIHVKVVRQT
jgi:uncharacterized phage protein gp47/JayE